MVEKVTTMILKVDLKCPSCYKKIKKILCKFPQIRDQVYDEKNDTVKIVVVCCSPEKIRDKLCCKGGKVIKSIEIVHPPKPKPPEKPKESEEPPKEPKKPRDTEEPDKPRDPESRPMFSWYGRPISPPWRNDGYGKPVDENYGYGCGYGYDRGCYVKRYDCFSEENPTSCTIM